MRKCLLLAMILLIMATVCTPALARFAYVTAARNSTGAQNTGFTMAGLAVSSARFSGPQSGWASSGAGPYSGPGIVGTGYAWTNNACYFMSDTGTLWGQWTFSVPDNADKSGYYDVYYGIRYCATASQDIPPVWTITNASGIPFINSTQTSSTNSNQWVKIGTQLQFNRGTDYTVRCANRGTGAAGKRMNLDMVAFVFVKTNAPQGLTAVVSGDGTSIDLAWTAPDPAPASYIIQRKAGPLGAWEDLATGVTTTTYSDVTPLCGTNWYYQVKAVDAAGVVSGACDPVFCMRCAPEPPQKATNPSPAMDADGVHTDLGDAGIPGKLSWTPDVAAQSHDVYLGTDPGALDFKGNQIASSYAPGALLANTDYYWRIDEVNSAGTTTGDVWHFKTGISLTISPIRATNRGTIDHFFTDFTPDGTREWNTTTWHKSGDNVYISATVNAPYTWVGWSTNADGSSPFQGNGLDPELWAQQWSPYVMPAQTNNLTLYAVYQGTQHSLTVNCVPAEGGYVVATNATWPAAPLTAFEAGESAHLVATPTQYWQFAGYSSDKTGTFVDPYAATTNYTMTEEDTVITAYFTKAIAKIVDSTPRSIAASSLAGGDDIGFTGTVNVNSYSPSLNRLWSRVVLFPSRTTSGTVRPMTIPAASLRSGPGRLAVDHIYNGSYSSLTDTVVEAFPITTPWMGGSNVTGPPEYRGATWLTTGGWYSGIDENHPAPGNWATAGGDMNVSESLGTRMMRGVLNETLNWQLDAVKDYKTIFEHGIILKADHEGDIAYRKGIGTGTVGNGNAPYLSFPYNPPTGAGSGVITDWALLGAYAQGASGDGQARIDTDQASGTYNGVPVTETYLAPKAGVTYNGCTWKVCSSSSDLIDLLDPAWLGPVGTCKVAYAAVYVKNNGGAKDYFIGMGSDDYSKTWLDTATRAYKYSSTVIGYDQVFQGPFTMAPGWHRLLVKVENGIPSGYFLYLRLANADRTALTGIEELAFATTDNTAPTNPTATEMGGAPDGGMQWAVNSPQFTFSGAVDPEVPGEGVSGVKGFKLYFGPDPAGVPTAFQTSWTFSPGPQPAGTQYLRVTTVDQALNESAPATVFTFIKQPDVSEAKGMADAASVVTSPAVVTALINGGFYMEAPDRTSGIRVAWTGFPVAISDVICVAGHMATNVDGERQIVASSVMPGGSSYIEPLVATNKTIGGGDWAYNSETGAGQRGVIDGVGLNNIGLLVRTTGYVAAVGSDYIIINDGSEARGGSLTNGVRIACPGLIKPMLHQTVVVTGISTIHNVRGNLYRCVLVTSQSGLQME